MSDWVPPGQGFRSQRKWGETTSRRPSPPTPVLRIRRALTTLAKQFFDLYTIQMRIPRPNRTWLLRRGDSGTGGSGMYSHFLRSARPTAYNSWLSRARTAYSSSHKSPPVITKIEERLGADVEISDLSVSSLQLGRSSGKLLVAFFKRDFQEKSK